jgi:hypothetical protein
MDQNTDRLEEGDRRRRQLTAGSIALYGFLAIAGFYLIAEHRAHALGWLPWLLIFACPLLHIFVHRKHGARGHDHEEKLAQPRHPSNPN